MNVLLVSDNELVEREVRRILVHEGLDCPSSGSMTTSQAASRLHSEQADVIVLVMPSEPEQAVAALGLVSQLPSRSTTRVIAIGPAEDARLVLKALRGAVDDYLDQDDLESELLSAIERMRSDRAAHNGVGRVISLLAPSGGSGSSTLAVNLAAALAMQYKSSALLDLKLESGDLAALLDLKPQFTLADLGTHVERFDRGLFERALIRHRSGVHLLAPPRRISEVEHVTPEVVQQVLGMAKNSFPFVFIDLDHSFRSEQIAAIRQTDILLVVLRLDFISLRQTRRVIEHVTDLEFPRERIRLVVNRYGQPKEIPYSRAEDALGTKITHFVPDDPRTVNRSTNNGIPMVIESPTSRIAKSLSELAQSVNGKCKLQ